MIDVFTLFAIFGLWTGIITSFCYPRWKLEDPLRKKAGAPSTRSEEIMITISICSWFAAIPTLISVLIYLTFK